MAPGTPITRVRQTPLLDPSGIIGLAEVISVLGLAEPAALARAFAGALAFKLRAETLVKSVAMVRQIGVPAVTACPTRRVIHGELHP
jgi:hypothetical protein